MAKFNRKLNYVFIFQYTNNMALTKDIGMIPYYFHRLFNFNSKIVTYKIGEYPNLKKNCNGLKLHFIKRSRRFEIVRKFCEKNVLKYLVANAKKIDILNLTYFTIINIIYGIIYKLLNRNGFLYLKMDVNILFKKINFNNWHLHMAKRFMFSILFLHFIKLPKMIFLKIIDLISFESREIFEFSIKTFPKLKQKLIYMTNGFDDFDIKKVGANSPFSEKENIILSVGRLGTYQKATEILLEALSKIKDLKNWKVYLVGHIEANFKEFIKKYFIKNPQLKKKIIFTGNIINRDDLYEFYQKSKIFCLTSRYEGFPFVLIEAAYFGNYIVSTKLLSSREITKKGTLGSLFPLNDVNKLAEILQELINNEAILKENYLKIIEHAENNHSWTKNVHMLYNEFLKRRK